MGGRLLDSHGAWTYLFGGSDKIIGDVDFQVFTLKIYLRALLPWKEYKRQILQG